MKQGESKEYGRLGQEIFTDHFEDNKDIDAAWERAAMAIILKYNESIVVPTLRNIVECMSEYCDKEIPEEEMFADVPDVSDIIDQAKREEIKIELRKENNNPSPKQLVPGIKPDAVQEHLFD